MSAYEFALVGLISTTTGIVGALTGLGDATPALR
jgi:hypothetical protein